MTHDAGLVWPRCSAHLHGSSGSPPHQQLLAAQYEAEVNRPVERSPSECNGGFKFPVSSSSSNSSVYMGGQIKEVQVDCPLHAHFMAVAAKLVYEAPEIVADCLEHRCRVQCLFGA